VGKLERKRTLGRTRRRWEDITKVFKKLDGIMWLRMEKNEGPTRIRWILVLVTYFNWPSDTIKFIIIIIIIIL
jgi:uncharacterized membrane protein YkvA (DUF1232 family)